MSSNPLKVVTLTAYNKDGEVVDTVKIQSRTPAELHYMEFEDTARSEYAAIRIVMEVAFMLLLTLSPLISSAGASTHGYNPRYLVAGTDHSRNNNPFSGAREFTITMDRQPDFLGPHEPVPYADIWNNPLRQTAQQYVAILSLLQEYPPTPNVLDLSRKAKEERLIDNIKEGMRTDRYGPRPYQDTSATNTYTAIGLALLCLGGLSLVFYSHACAGYRNQRKFWKQRRRSS